MPRRCPDDCRLLHGPYAAPPLRVGDREACLVRDCLCAVTGRSAGRIPWPMGVPVGGRSGPAFIVTDELARAVRRLLRLSEPGNAGHAGEVLPAGYGRRTGRPGRGGPAAEAN